MSRPIKLYPGSDNFIFHMPYWLDVVEDPTATELWIDFHAIWSYEMLLLLTEDRTELMPSVHHAAMIESAETIVLYDWMHGQETIEDYKFDWVRDLAKQKPLTWITLNPKPVDGVKTIHFDYYWNRTKRAFVDKQPIHRLYGVENFQQYPIHTNHRQKKYLTYHLRDTEDYRIMIRDRLVNNHDGFYNDPKQNIWLAANTPHPAGDVYTQSGVAPPARVYYDESYVTCLVETQHLGTHSHLVSEKTYDNLIQGRGVLNFATPGFYGFLQSQGWKLPSGIDWSWDTVVDDRQRLDAYLGEIDKLFSRSLDDLHAWFLSNIDCWTHNQQMLASKPFHAINLAEINS
jgi:hypothetical protein